MKRKLTAAAQGDTRAQKDLQQIAAKDKRVARRLKTQLAGTQGTTDKPQTIGNVEKKLGAEADSDRSKIPKTMNDLRKQLGQFDYIKIGKHTPRSIAEKTILSNPRVTNDMLRKIAGISDVKQIADTERYRTETKKEFDDYKNFDGHRFAVALMSGLTNLPADQISAKVPSLGFTSEVDAPLGIGQWKAGTKEGRVFSATHDVTSYLQNVAGVKGLQSAVWGLDGSVSSALTNYPYSSHAREPIQDLENNVNRTIMNHIFNRFNIPVR